MENISINKQQGLLNAAYIGRIDDVREYLNDDTVDVNGKNTLGETALHWACWRNGNRDVAELLLNNGADIDARMSDNSTPLIQASVMGYASTTKLLLDRGCAVNAVDNHGYTALHWACWFDNTECVKELLAHGADTSIKNNYNETPLDLAKERNYQAVIDLLMEHTKRSQQALTNSIEDASNAITSEVSRLLKELDLDKEEKHQAVINSLMELMERPQQTLTKSIEDAWNALVSEVSRLEELDSIEDAWNAFASEVRSRLEELDLDKEKKHQVIYNNLMEHEERPQQALTNSIEDAWNAFASEVSRLEEFDSIEDAWNAFASELSRLEELDSIEYAWNAFASEVSRLEELDLDKEKKHQAVINNLMEHEERPQQALTNSIEDASNDIASEVSRLKAEVVVSPSEEERLVPRVETIMGRRCEEQKKSNRNALSQSKMNSKISSIERELDSMKMGMTQIHEEQNTMARNLERMNHPLQRLTGDHSIVSNAIGPLLLLLLGLVLHRRRVQ